MNSFGRLYKEYLYKRLKDPVFAFLREAFEDYLKKRYKGGRVSHLIRPFRGMDSAEVAKQCSYVTQRQASEVLGIQVNNLEALINRGTLRALRKPNGRNSLWLIDKADVEALLEEWKDLLSLDDVAQICLGISKQQVLALTRAGLLNPARGRDIDRCLIRYYRREEIEQLEYELLKYASRAEPPALKCVPLSNIWNSIGLPLFEGLKEILGAILD